MSVIGGMPVGPDSRVHTTFTSNPSTLRFSSVGPNLQNLPRGGESEEALWVKSCFVAPAGSTFWARDFSAIEAVLVGYFAGSARYVRFAKLGVHAYLASHLVGRPADLAWGEGELRRYFKQLKAEEGATYNIAKRVVHLSNYLGTPRKMADTAPEAFPTVKDAARLQGIYFDLFPEIRTWHRTLCERVDAARRRKADEGEVITDPWTLGVAYARNPFGYVHRFFNVLEWEKVDGTWYSSFGEDAKRLIAFLPQSTAAAIIKRAARVMWEDYPWVGQTLRLLIHDEALGECAEADLETCLRISREVMEAPIPELPLDPSWGLGEALTIGTEAKAGPCWGTMRTVKED